MDGNYGQNQNWQTPNQNQPNQNWQNQNQNQQNQNWQDPYQSQQNQNWQNSNQNANIPNQGYSNNGGNNGYNSYMPNNYNGPIVVSNAVAPKSGGLAVGSLVCGIISIIGCWSLITLIVAVVGVVLGTVNNVQDNPNKGMAIAGIILSIVGFLFSIVFLVFWMLI